MSPEPANREVKMIVGLGTDIVSTERIAAVWDKNGGAFAARICRSDEENYLQCNGDPVMRLAKIWAAKEAAVKALGTGFAQGVTFKDIALRHNAYGKPELEFYGRAKEILQALVSGGTANILISLSDDKPFAQAVVIIEKI